MKKIIRHTGLVVPLNVSNIDTDIIIPKQFLKSNVKTGFGKNLFYNWRYLNGLKDKKNFEFILNQDSYTKADVLLTRENFGCGSSREHAVWALVDYGFKAIIAPSFSDIFYNNAINNRLLLINFSKEIIDELFSLFNNNKSVFCTISLLDCKITIRKKDYFFKINSFYRFCLLNGLDSIDYTMRYEREINNYEQSIPSFLLYKKNAFNLFNND
ncbi:3-isopropylmalate dehydratase small subunit [Buchnera aphidicola]|uniref:3-isopropylmalate dehydratase small subunit n=1 Tax=Buchnera aphidicola (Anoecia oenotherae) TaxID=1241833 RepID=A0A4D6Y4K9_9GAMM|nr:3-isopropylmalate dehydratase small subunit [Buchnera aphidicola]QCI19355.1 3-isopropylmalate dehydratase small subunit [Buchnera aphidicola (Anoecia oenotherae)]